MTDRAKIEHDVAQRLGELGPLLFTYAQAFAGKQAGAVAPTTSAPSAHGVGTGGASLSGSRIAKRYRRQRANRRARKAAEKEEKEREKEEEEMEDEEMGEEKEKESPAISTSLSPSHQSSKEPTRLEHIKRQLLAKTDWAAVSAARPLKITFPQLEELAQFGKRRKLTEADRRRLDKSNNQVSHEERLLFRKGFRKNETSSEVGTIDGLEIRINGKKAGVDQMPTFEDIQQSNLSSQPMLLDREEIVPREQSSASMSNVAALVTV
ncbi:hypothetical protein APSETT445_000480 [Aspergillus pseudonomiae]